jgi:hypothetical protein
LILMDPHPTAADDSRSRRSPFAAGRAVTSQRS